MTTKQETYQITASSTPGATKIPIALSVPPLRADNLGLITWGGAFILANILHRLPIHDVPSDTPVPVLELGAGTGLVGITAAALWKTHVVLTDLEPIVPGLVANIALNREMLTQYGGRVSSGTLDWNSPTRLILEQEVAAALGVAELIVGERGDDRNKATIILCADTMYSEEHPELISQTIFAQLQRDPNARAVLCYPMRVAYLDAMREFYERMEQGGMVLVEEGREELPDDSWDDERQTEWNVWTWKDV